MIAGLVDAAKLNWAHVAIAQLISAGYVDRVLTTNFDLLVPRACALVGEFPAIYDFAASPDFRHAQIPDKAVFCLHGQYTGFRLVNTDDECMQQFVTLRPILDNTLPGRPVIVAGYSGENDPVFTYLAERENFEYRLYWIDYEKEPSTHLRQQLLEKKEKDAHFLGGCDADAFFTELASKLGCFPPAFIERPFSYLNGLLDRVAPFRFEKSSQDFTESTRQRIVRAIEVLEKGDDAESSRLAKLSEAEQKLMAGDFAAVFEILPSPNDPAACKLLARAHVSWGSALTEQAKRKTGEGADRLFALAAAQYEAALAIKPDDDQALFNWGVALSEQARRKTGEEAGRLFALAGRKYEAVLAITPDMYEALNNWGGALTDQARLKTGEEAELLLELAGAKYEAALAIKPDAHEALSNWGIALLMQSWLLAGEEGRLALQRAEAVLRRSAQIKPNNLYNHACLASIQGKPEECRELLFRCLKARTLPGIAHINSDPDLAAVRDLGWFQDLLREARATQGATE
jgi:tetratricopeptide (TPR) repeat protein